MRRRASLLHSREFFVRAQQLQKIALLQAMLSDCGAQAADLAQQIVAEEERTKIKDKRHPAYSMFAMAAEERRKKLLATADGLRSQLNAADREIHRELPVPPHPDLAHDQDTVVVAA
jgi:flagellar protein FliJ